MNVKTSENLTENNIEEIIVNPVVELTEEDIELQRAIEKSQKHKLKRDIIFKGRTDKDEEDDDFFDINNIRIHSHSDYSGQYIEQNHFYNEYRNVRVKQYVYEILKNDFNLKLPVINEHGEIIKKADRRKPSPKDFNTYFEHLINNTKNESFTYVEVFNELAFYFCSDNYTGLNKMFKLLDKKYTIEIIKELIKYNNNFKMMDYINELDINI